MRILVLSNCTNRKRISSVAQVRVQDLCKGTVQEVANQWVQALDRQIRRTPLMGVYCGRGFSEALRTTQLLKATLLVVSAGLGLVNANSSIPTYGATVTNGSSDNILAKLTDGDADSWWRVINEVSPFSEPLTTETFDLVLIAVSRPYFSLLRPTLEKLPEAEKRKLRLFLSMSIDELPPSLRELLMPYGSRFDHSDGPLPGTKSDFTQRAMRHFADLINGSDSHNEDPFRHSQRVETELQSLSPPTRPVRVKLPDSEIEGLIKKHWGDTGGTSSKTLRYLRDVLSVACEQKRFQNIFNQVKIARVSKVSV